MWNIFARKTKLALIGTTDFSQQIKDFAEETGKYKVVCYYNDIVEAGTPVGNDGLLCRGKVINSIDDFNNGVFDCIFICVGYTRFDLREYFYKLLKGKVPLATIIMPKASLGKNVRIGEGVFIGNNTVVSDRSVIKDNVVILKDNFIAHDNIVNSHSYIAGRSQTAGFVTIGERCFIGIACLVADHISICDDVWLSLGSIVARKIKKPGKYLSPAIKLVNIG